MQTPQITQPKETQINTDFVVTFPGGGKGYYCTREEADSALAAAEAQDRKDRADEVIAPWMR